MRFVAPRDGARGGTWVLLNERGLAVCVLNDYEAGGVSPGRRSRGELPLLAAGAGDAREAIATLRRSLGEPRDFAPFKLVAVARGGVAQGLEWDGANLVGREGVGFMSSSSFAPAEVRRAREAAHAALGPRPSARALADLHWRHEVAAGAWSLRMCRADARTRSICAVSVEGRGAGVPPRASLRHTFVDWSRVDGVGESVEAGF